MLTIAFLIIFFFKQAQIRASKKWPTVNCVTLKSSYSKTELFSAASIEYEEMVRTNGSANMIGALKCQCLDDIKKGGLSGYSNAMYKDKYNITVAGATKEVLLCKGFATDTLKEKFMNNAIKYIIIVLNTVIRMACIYIISKVGCSTESTEMIYTTNVVFVCTFFNTGILPMLCTANLEN